MERKEGEPKISGEGGRERRKKKRGIKKKEKT